MTGSASRSATAMGYTAWLSNLSGDEFALRSTNSATTMASSDGPMSDFHAPSGSGRRICSLEMTGSQVSPKMKQVMHAPTRGIHNMAAALRSRMRWSSSLALSAPAGCGAAVSSLNVRATNSSATDVTSEHAISANPMGEGESGSAAKWTTAAATMPHALLNSKFSGSSHANTEPHAVASMASPAPNARPNMAGSANGSVSCVYSGSMNCTPMATRQAPVTRGAVRVRSGVRRSARLANMASAASTMPAPVSPQPAYTAKGCSEGVAPVPCSEKKRIALRKTENSSPAPSSAGLNETGAGDACFESCCCALSMPSLQRLGVFPRR